MLWACGDTFDVAADKRTVKQIVRTNRNLCSTETQMKLDFFFFSEPTAALQMQIPSQVHADESNQFTSNSNHVTLVCELLLAVSDSLDYILGIKQVDKVQLDVKSTAIFGSCSSGVIDIYIQIWWIMSPQHIDI